MNGLTVVLMTAVAVGGATPAGAIATDASAVYPGPDLPAVTACDRTATEAVAAQNRTRGLVRELRRFARERSAVDPEAKQAASFHLDRGEQRFRNERYCASIQQFRTARERARAELTAAYKAEAQVLLDASAARLTDIHGSSGDVRTLTARVDDFRDRLAAADSLRESRAVYRAARSLHADTAGVGLSVRTRVLECFWVTFGGGAVGVFLAGAYGGVWWSRRSGSSGGVTMGGGD